MLEVTNLKANGFDVALRGMRNPMNSWLKSDSAFGISKFEETGDIIRSFVMEFSNSDEQTNNLCEYYTNNCVIDSFSNYDIYALIGPKDMELCQRLIAAGPEHAKFLRQINISFDISAPLYW